jgi:lysozyme
MKMILEKLSDEEGFMPRCYKCSKGFNTIGKGYNLDANPLNIAPLTVKSYIENGISEDDADYLMERYVNEIEKTLSVKIEWFKSLDEARRGVLIMMAYQMGVIGLLKFKNALFLIKQGGYKAASNELLDSLWAKQTPRRAHRMAKQMELGVWQ